MSWPTLRSRDMPATTSPLVTGGVVVGAHAATALAAAAFRSSRRLMEAGRADVLPPAAYRRAPRRAPRARPARRHKKGAPARAAPARRRTGFAGRTTRRRLPA